MCIWFKCHSVEILINLLCYLKDADNEGPFSLANLRPLQTSIVFCAPDGLKCGNTYLNFFHCTWNSRALKLCNLGRRFSTPERPRGHAYPQLIKLELLEHLSVNSTHIKSKVLYIMENSSSSRNPMYQTLQNNQMPKDIEAMKLESSLHVIRPIGYAPYDS